MKRIYHMIVECIDTGERKRHSSIRQGECPRGYKLICVCGYSDK